MTSTTESLPYWHKSLARALERRFGKSKSPVAFKRISHIPAFGDVWRVTDTDTGSFVEAVYLRSTRRIEVRRSHDGVALGPMAPVVEVTSDERGEFVVTAVRDTYRHLPRWVEAGKIVTPSVAARLNREYGSDAAPCIVCA